MNNKEDLLNKLKQLEEDFNKQVSDIKEQIKQCDKENKVWIPKENEKYWYLNELGFPIEDKNEKYLTDNNRFDFGNCFKTQEEAERKMFEIKLHRKLELFALENNDTEIDWNDSSEKYKINYSKDKGIYIHMVYSLKDFGQVYFTSRGIAEKALEAFKDDLIRYFKGDK